VQLWPISSWHGGLNLRDDAFQISEHELSDAENIVVFPQGGIERRRALDTFSVSGLTVAPANIWQFLGAGVSQVVVQHGNDVAFATSSGAFTVWNPDGLTTAGVMRAAALGTLTGAGALNVNDESLYIQRNAERAGLRFRGSGAASAVLADAAAAFNDDLTAPAGGRLPVARFVATHLNYLWNAYTLEGGNAHKNRVRFSHPGEPEDYRTNDYLDVDSGVDSDEITGIVAFGDRLFVFKQRSVYAITGYSPETFEVFPVVQGVGAPSQEAIAVSRFGLAFYDPMLGVHLITQRGEVQWLWAHLADAIQDATIQAGSVDGVTACWLDDRLFVSVPWGAGATSNTRTFVYDPVLGKGGAWYVYTYGVGPMLDWRPSLTLQQHLACSGDTYILEVEATKGGDDDIDGVDTPFDSSFTTAWFAAGKPGVRKRWRRPTLIVDNDSTATLNVKVWRDYKTTTLAREFNLDTSAIAVGMVWGDDWGGNWGAGTDGDQTIKSGSGLGRAYAIRVKVTGPESTHWGLNSIEFRYILQRIR
jgi:hypothetical protein